MDDKAPGPEDPAQPGQPDQPAQQRQPAPPVTPEIDTGDENLENVQVHEIGNRIFIVADVEPLDVDGTRTVAVGTALWAVAFVLLLPFYGRLEESGNLWWLWTCAAGFGLGILGWDHCRRRRRAARLRTAPGRPS